MGSVKGIKEIMNERDLIKRTVEYLDQFNDDASSTNNSRFPTLLISMGEKTEEVLYDIRDTLDHNWSNAMHLEFMNVTYKGPDTWSSKRFRSQEEHENEADLHGEDIDRNEWVAANEDFQGEAVKAEYRMLEKKANFASTGSIKLDFILDATDEHAEEYYNLFKSFKFTSNHMQYKTLYLLLSQKDLDNSLEQSEKMLQKILYDQEISDCCVYLLSDELSDGSSLSKTELRTNYRLIADLVFLGGDRENEAAGRRVLESGVKLASYTVFSKPTDQIGEVTIGHLLYKIYETEENRFSTIKLQPEDIKKRLGIRSDGVIEAVEAEWGNFRRKLPNANQNPIEYFPYAEKNGLNSAKKEAKRDLRAGFAELSKQTYGVSDAYLVRNYKESIGTYFEDNNLEKKVYEYIKKRFNYFELLQIKQFYNDLRETIMLDMPINFSGNSFEELFQKRGEQVAKKEFYSIFKALFCAKIEELIEAAENFSLNYKNMRNQLDIARSINGEEEQTIETYYGRQVDEYILKKRGNSNEIAFSEFFDVDHDKKQMLQSIFNIYREMIDEVEVYSYDFEEELRNRMDNLTPQQVTLFINQYFADNMEKNLRLNAVGQLRPNLSQLSSYYLLNTNAAYYSYLKNAEDFKNEKYKLIKLRRSDGIEQLAIYGIRDVREISIDSRNKGKYAQEMTSAAVNPDIMQSAQSKTTEGLKTEVVEQREKTEQEILQDLYDEL